jgi:hypothetical protein
MANKPEEFPVFTHLDKTAVQKMLSKMAGYLSNVSEFG